MAKESAKQQYVATKELVKRLLFEATEFDERSEEPRPNDRFIRFSPDDFFQRWFRIHGDSYYFNFKKNLHVTNLQFAELVALLQSLGCDRSGIELELQFASNREFRAGLRDIVGSFPIRTRGDAEFFYDLVAELYHGILESTVVIDPYFGSCSVFLPHNMLLDLAQLCAYGGYIHSCGRSVYVKNANDANAKSFSSALERYLKQFYPDTMSILFVVYAEEDFTQGDIERQRRERLMHGLSDKKIYVERFYMGEDRLVKVLQELARHPKLGVQLEIPPPGDRIKTHGNIDRRNSIWLVKDNSVHSNGERGEEVYYICYHQLYKNANPFHLFDENKPAWMSHTTTPHTLIGAMLNVTRPGWPNRPPKICDPFVSTGTTMFEALKFDNASIFGSDLSPATEFLCHDNVRIFSASPGQLDEWGRFLSSASGPMLPSFRTSKTDLDFMRGYLKVREHFAGFVYKEGEIQVLDEEKLAIALADESFEERLVTYSALRALRRNEGAHLRGRLDDVEWDRVVREEAIRLAHEIGELSSLRQKELFGKIGCIAVVGSMYSEACTIEPQVIDSEWKKRVTIRQMHVEDLEFNEYDVIIADPPYGFNTDDEIERMARLYGKMIPILVKALRDGGQLVLALPERSYTGRKSPYFMHKEVVTQQVLLAAKDANREIVTRSVPEPTKLYRPPYYWRSEKALSRAILHFRFRRQGKG